jgi:hypothetical protein
LLKGLEAPSGFEPEMEVLQTSALPLGYGALGCHHRFGRARNTSRTDEKRALQARSARLTAAPGSREEDGAGNGIRTRDFDLGKVALYH